jgi:methyl-accepting chemotaxis protein
MNAAIEAAHAGVHGKGFSVVADEVRKLAETSSKNANIIKDKIRNMEQLVTDGVSLSDKAGESLKKVAENAAQSETLIEEISQAMQEQSRGAQEIVGAINSVVDVSQSIRDQTRDEKKMCEDIKSFIAKSHDISETLKHTADDQAVKSGGIVNDVEEVTRDTRQVMEVLQDLMNKLKRFRI